MSTRSFVRPRAYVGVRGPDAADLLQRLVSNDVLAGESCEALLLTPKGRVIWHDGLAPDVTVALPDSVRLVIPDDLRGMTVDELRASPDLQVLRAIEILLGKPL